MYDWAPIKAISDIFRGLLDIIHNLVPSYGWSIIILTILFRGLLLPLDVKSKISMKKQALLQPKIAKINEKYKNDKEKAAQKTMELYKEEKTSPLSGCLPSIIQLPLFFAFFGALQLIAGQEIFKLFTAMQTNPAAVPAIESWLWVHNVWQPDVFAVFNGMNSAVIPPFTSVQTFAAFKAAHITAETYNSVMGPLMQQYAKVNNGWFILPLLAGASSYLQTKITMPPQPTVTDPNAQKNPFNNKTMQYIFPLMSVFFTATSNSVFALYWFTSNLCSVATFWSVDRIWAMNAHKREAAEKAKQETLALEEAGKAAKTAAVTVKAEPKPAGKSNPKEGKKK